MKYFAIAPEVNSEQAYELNDRQKFVLKEVCNAFITTRVPVGSRTISRLGKIAYSPATIRNEMADLELMGYLYSPHTSAGRIPTEKGYRFYVNFLLEYERISQLEEALLKKIAENSDREYLEMQEILKTAIRYACQKTNLAGVLLAPRKLPNVLQSIRLFRILENKAMLVTVDENNNITDQIITIPSDISDDVIDKLAILLNAQLCHNRYHQYEKSFIEQTRQVLSRYNNLLSTLVNKVKAAFKEPEEKGIFFDGFVNFFEQPEFNDPEKMKEMLRLLDQKEKLLKILAKSLDSDKQIMVNIGSDSGLEIRDISVVTSKYHGPNCSVGRISLIGPLRMDYRKVICMLIRLSNTLSQLLIGNVTLNNKNIVDMTF